MNQSFRQLSQDLIRKQQEVELLVRQNGATVFAKISQYTSMPQFIPTELRAQISELLIEWVENYGLPSDLKYHHWGAVYFSSLKGEIVRVVSREYEVDQWFGRDSRRGWKEKYPYGPMTSFADKVAYIFSNGSADFIVSGSSRDAISLLSVVTQRGWGGHQIVGDTQTLRTILGEWYGLKFLESI